MKRALFHDDASPRLAIGPVSYTHLDVYKRQLLQCLLEISDTLESELGHAALERDARHRRDTKGRIDYDNLLAREHSVSLAPPSSETLQLLYTDSLTEVYNRRYYSISGRVYILVSYALSLS